MLWFLLLLVPCYLVVWPLFGLIAPFYRHLLAGGLQLVYTLTGSQFEFSAAGSELFFHSFARPRFEANLSTSGVDANTVFLCTLLLCTPGMNLVNRMVRFSLGIVVLSISHLLFLITKVEAALIAADHPLAGVAPFWNSLDNFFEITGRVFFPIVIWLLLGLPYMMGSVDPPRQKPSRVKIGRNDPCYCGSGRKYKHCHGS